MKPSIGCTVHYQRYGTPGREYKSEPSAAIITEVVNEEEGIVHMTVLNQIGFHFNRDVPFSEEPKPGHWNWPPRVVNISSDQGVTESLKQFAQKLQQPEMRAILQETFSEATQIASETPDFSKALEKFFEVSSIESDEINDSKTLYKLLSHELRKMSPEYTEKYFNEMLIHKDGLEYHLSFVFPMNLSDEAREKLRLYKGLMTKKDTSQSS